jgi:glycosyltransferase involved in cell wall biosynthesis
VGRLCPEKGITTLLEAWKRAAPAIPLKIAGDGPSAPEVAAAAATVPGVEWLGARSHAEVMDLMRQSQFLIMPSRLYESFGLCIIEAFSAGVPCIVSGHGSMQELVEDGVTGLHFQPGNSQDLTAKIQWMTENVIQRKQMGQAALARYRANFTPDQNYRILMGIYDAARARLQTSQAPILNGIASQGCVYQGNNGTPIS